MLVRTALIVEDDVLFARCLKRMLRADQIPAKCAHSLGEARKLLLDRSVPPAYVFLELRLPDGDGADILPLLHSVRPRPRVAVTSGHLDAGRIIALHEAVMIAVPKPIDQRQLSELVRLVCCSEDVSDAVDGLARMHGLSPREARLLRLAVAGANNDEAAAMLACARPTVGTYWNRIFAKTGRRCQRDVIAMLLQQRR